MKNFLIISNNYKDIENRLAERICEYIRRCGAECKVSGEEKPKHGRSYKYTNPNEVDSSIECVITVGGDGTLLGAANDLIGRDVVFIGINLGKLGYLAEMNTNDFESMIDSLINDEYSVEERMMICGNVVRDGQIIFAHAALNDIVLHREISGGLIGFNIYVNGKYLSRYNADGVIFSTPTGSTAYNLSAGGPIVKPDARLILLTPICAHSINNHSIVLSENDEITIEICGDRQECASLTFDGDNEIEALEGDRIVITQYALPAKIARLGERSFIEILKEKMGDK